jgi:membrane protein
MLQKVREFIAGALRWLTHVIRQPREELDRWQRAVRYAYDLGRYGARQLQEDRAPQMAAALAYQALFALIPVFVVAMILVRGIIGVPRFLGWTETLLASAGLSTVTISRPAGVGAETQSISLQDWLEGLIGQAGRVDLAAVGWVGGIVIAYAAISMLVTIENSFNTIYRAPEGRPWARRVPLYWFLLTVSPIALSLTAVLHTWVETWADDLGWGPLFAGLVTIAWSISVGWLFWFGVYSLVPNTRVDVRASAAGALVCVVLLEIGKRTLGAYMSNAFAVSQLYGSLGLIPLFMFWIYLMWLAVLFGLEVSATLQFLGHRVHEEMETRRLAVGLIEPAAVVSVMQVIAEEFAAGQPATQRHIADRTRLPERVVGSIMQELCAIGLLHRLEREQSAVCLALPADQVTADRLMDVGFRLADGGGERWVSAFAERLRQQQRELARQFTLSALVAAK